MALRDAGDRGDVLGGVAAAAADEVDESGRGKALDLALHVVGEEIESGRGEGIGQSGIRIDRDKSPRDAGELGEVRLHEVGPERAVQPDREGFGMGDGIPEGLGLLRRDHRFPAASDRGRDDDGELDAVFVEDFAQGDEGGLGIERVEDGLDHHDVGPARDERADLMFVGLAHLVKGDDAEAGVLGVGRVRERYGHGSDRPGDVAFASGLVADAVAPLARELGGLVIDLPGELFEERIVADLAGKELGVLAALALFARVFDEEFALGEGGAGEGVRLDDVGSGLEETFVDVADDIGPREGEDVAVVEEVLDVRGKALPAGLGLGEFVLADGRAHRAVEDEDAFGELALQLFRVRGH
jgi:hypothetical protein